MSNTFNEIKLRDAVKHYREQLDIEKLLAIRLQHCMELGGKICREIADGIGKDLIKFKESDGILLLITRDRILSFAPAGGMASDARLRKPRGLKCRQVLIFGHLEGQAESNLLSTFRVYPDGFCSDGELTWKLDADELSVFANYLLELISSNLLDFEVFWPPTDELPDFIRKITIQENKPQVSQLQNLCIGFDCPIQTGSPTE